MIITGDKVYLPEGPTVSTLTIDQEEIDESREDGQTDEEVITNILNSHQDEWSQGWCNATIVTPEDAMIIKNMLIHTI